MNVTAYVATSETLSNPASFACTATVAGVGGEVTGGPGDGAAVVVSTGETVIGERVSVADFGAWKGERVPALSGASVVGLSVAVTVSSTGETVAGGRVPVAVGLPVGVPVVGAPVVGEVEVGFTAHWEDGLPNILPRSSMLSKSRLSSSDVQPNPSSGQLLYWQIQG